MRRARILFDLPPGAFRPRPKVVSSVLELTPRTPPLDPELATPRRSRLASLGFRSAPQDARQRARLRRPRARGGSEPSRDLGKSPRARAEELSLEDFLALAREWRPCRERARDRAARRRRRVRQERPLAAVRRLEHPRGRRRLVSGRDVSRASTASRRTSRSLRGERIDGDLPDPRPRGPHRRAPLPARVVRRAGLRLPVHARARPPAAGGGARRSLDRLDRGAAGREPIRGGRVLRHVLPRLALGARLRRDPHRGGRHGGSCTRATSSSTTIRPTARRPTARASRRRSARASTSRSSIRPTPSGRAARRPSARRGRGCARRSRGAAGGSS